MKRETAAAEDGRDVEELAALLFGATYKANLIYGDCARATLGRSQARLQARARSSVPPTPFESDHATRSRAIRIKMRTLMSLKLPDVGHGTRAMLEPSGPGVPKCPLLTRNRPRRRSRTLSGAKGTAKKS